MAVAHTSAAIVEQVEKHRLQLEARDAPWPSLRMCVCVFVSYLAADTYLPSSAFRHIKTPSRYWQRMA